MNTITETETEITMKSIADFLVGLATIAGLVYGCYAAVDSVLLAGEREECWRLGRQYSEGYIEAVPAWCAEVPR